MNFAVLVRLNFLSVNRFERKKNLQLAISAFAFLRSFGSAPPSYAEATLTIAGDYIFRLLSFFFIWFDQCGLDLFLNFLSKSWFFRDLKYDIII